ncbi:hypothetical protein NliqN6_0447 [Naganishia liquefaciens]|uniref:cysteine synthase n=1 Tax=Naganishia liquefaciens TaxID=104408 RepID=A0A8H3TPA1_9TREE|nr:hypothetical protein NliqN6_0447 [Naganishia liquefaciens]
MTSTAESIIALLPQSRPGIRISRDLIIGTVLGLTLTLSSAGLALWLSRPRWWVQGWEKDSSVAAFEEPVGRDEKSPIEIRSNDVVHGVLGLIGNTPLIRIKSLSDALGVEILGKAEFLNPGGSVKDRVALKIIEDAEEAGLLVPHTGCKIFEGTVGSTGISIATVGRAKGYDCCIIMPDDVAIEKVNILQTLGAEVVRVRPASIVDEKQFVNLARARALEFGHERVPVGAAPFTEQEGQAATDGDDVVATIAENSGSSDEKGFRPRGFFADQFENSSNFEAHYRGTGPEIWKQTRGNVDAFVSGAGTGGSLSGTATYLKRMNPGIRVVLADPEGSGLYNRVRYGVMFDVKEKEGRKRRHQVDTVVEGIGINRLTHNFMLGQHLIDDAYRVTDAEAVAMSRHLNNEDGLFLGSSSACNLVTSVRLSKKLPKGSTIVTILCDAGTRHQSKFWSDDYLQKNGIPISADISALLKG